MFVIYDKEKQRIPIKVWLDDISHLEPGCLEQATNLSNLPFATNHISLMPDTHQGYGMPIGGILATEGVVVPNAVGVDIGCGMGFLLTNIKYEDIKDVKTKDNQDLIWAILGNIKRNVPVGFNHHKEPQVWSGFDSPPAYYNGKTLEIIDQQLTKATYQLGTLGGGNHFVDLQVDKDGYLAIMIHSGSRNFGKQICDYYNRKAQVLNERWKTLVPKSSDLAFLPIEDDLGKEYMDAMNYALEFAKQNRHLIMERSKNVVLNMIQKYAGISKVKITQEVNIHHNYAAWENHYGKNVIIHRKGATLARSNGLGIIPGSMGTASHIVRGRGNDESFNSCSHGAGRCMGRRAATRKYTVQEVIEDIAKRGVQVMKDNKNDIAEECPWSYKDIGTVMDNQKDLVDIVNTLTPIGVLIA
jgi:tRNA-splicing ligase RtcB